jgi:nucleoside-diphosphate-sugar epimerase
MNKRALLTGATGFVGSNLVPYLLHENWDVHIVARFKSDTASLKKKFPDVKVHKSALDSESLTVVLEKSQPDVVFHVASLFLAHHEQQDISSLLASNLAFGINLLEAMVQFDSKTTRFVNTSTSWEHFENHHYNPVNLYAATKKAFGDVLQYYVQANGVQAITLKLFDTYGPGDTRPKLLNLLLESMKTGGTLELSLGMQKIDLVHIDDVVSAYGLAGERILGTSDVVYEEYGVATGDPITIREVVALVETTFQESINVQWGARAYRSREIMDPWKDYSVLPGWSPMSLADGLTKFLV